MRAGARRRARPTALEVVDAPVAIGNDDEPGPGRARRRPTRRSCRPPRRVADGRADALVSAGSTGAALAAALLHVKRHARRLSARRSRCCCRVPGRPVFLLDARRHRRGAARAAGPVRLHGRGLQREGAGRRAAAGRAAVGRRGAGQGHARRSWPCAACGAGAGRRSSSRERRGRRRSAGGVVGRGRHGRLHRQRGAEADGGTTRTLAGAIREAVRSGTLSKLGGLLLDAEARQAARPPRPRAVGGAYLLGLSGLVVVCHGRSSRRAIPNAIELAARGVDEQVVEKTRGAALEAAGVARPRGETAAGDAHPRPCPLIASPSADGPDPGRSVDLDPRVTCPRSSGSIPPASRSQAGSKRIWRRIRSISWSW